MMISDNSSVAPFVPCCHGSGVCLKLGAVTPAPRVDLRRNRPVSAHSALSRCDQSKCCNVTGHWQPARRPPFAWDGRSSQLIGSGGTVQARTERSHGIERSGGVCRLAVCRLAVCRLAVRLAVRMLVALGLLAIVVTGSASAAFAADQSPTPAQVKYYIVPPAGRGPATLFEIAAQTLGNGNRFWQIYRLNKGRLQPDGRRLENPKIIEPGWVLELPAYASGPGVHVGPLPQPSPSASTGPTSGQSRPPRPSGHASSSSPASAVIIAGFVLAMIGALAVVGALLGRSRTSRHRRVTDRGRGRLAHPRTQEKLPLPDAIDPMDWSWPSSVLTPADLPADHPSRPQPAVDYRDWPADHPSRPQPAVDYRDWPADHPSRPQPAVDYRDWPDGPRSGASTAWPRPAGPLPAGPLPAGPPGVRQTRVAPARPVAGAASA